MPTDCLGAILAGGSSSRMGRDKALIPVGGVAMIDRVAAALRPVAGEIVVVGRSGTLAGLRCVPDRVPGPRGPLAGLAAALDASAGRHVLLVAVDQPLVSSATLDRLAGLSAADGAVVPLDGGARQVTCAVYPPDWAAEARREDEAAGSIQSLLDRLPWRAVDRAEWEAWGEDGRSWLSVDSPAAVAQAEARLALP